jgi:DNA-binding beta-propeller fold protein YncE
MAAGADGARLFVASTVTEGSRTTAVLQALDVATGRSLWTMTAEGVWGALRETLAVSPDARVVYAARMVAAPEDGSAIIVDARDAASGTVVWSARHDDGYGQGVAIAPDGSAVYVAGAWSYGYLQVVAYRASDGARLWLSQWVNTDAPFQPRSITVSPDGGLLALTGENSDAFDEEFVTTRVLDARSGVRLWDDRDFVPGAAVTFGCDGSTVFSTGATGSGYWTFAYEAVTGRKRWEAFALNTPAGTYFAPVAAEAIATSADCTRVYVAGRLGGLSDIRAYDAPTGRELWTGRADGTADRPCFCGGADDLSVAPDGTVYAAGGNGRLLTMSYDR